MSFATVIFICVNDAALQIFLWGFSIHVKAARQKTRCVVDVTKHKQSGLEDKSLKSCTFFGRPANTKQAAF